MAAPPAIARKKVTADIIPPFFSVLISKPAGDGWQEEILDGRYQVVSINEADAGEFSTLTLSFSLGADPAFPDVIPQVRAETLRLQAGSRVRIVDTVTEKEWFVGYAGQENTLIQANPQAEQFQVTVYGPGWLLAGQAILGKWFAKNREDRQLILGLPTDFTRKNIQATPIPCIFNEDGLPDMSKELWETSTPDKTEDAVAGAVFVPGDRRIIENGVVKSEAQIWTAYRALRSVVELFDDYDVISPRVTDWKSIETTLQGLTIGEVSIDGMTVPDAIQAILGPLGYSWRLEVFTDGKEKHALTVYPLKATAFGRQPYLPPAGAEATDEQGSRGEITRIDGLRDAHNIRNVVQGVGQPTVGQRKLVYRGNAGSSDLFPAWSFASDQLAPFFNDGIFIVAQVPVDQNEVLVNNYHTSGPNFQTNRDAWRTFVFNEDGGLDVGLNDFGTEAIPFLPSYGFGEALFRRPIGSLLVRSFATSDFQPARVEMVVTVGGDTFTIDVAKHFKVLKDRAGIRLETDMFQIDKATGNITAWRPFEKMSLAGKTPTVNEKAAINLAYLTMLNNAITESGDSELVLKVTGTLQKDENVSGFVNRLNTSPLLLDRERVVRNPSLQKNVVQGAAIGGEDTRDDSDKALAQAKAVQFADDSEIGHASIMFHHLTQAYPPGTAISQTGGRIVNLRLNGQRDGSAPVVRRTIHHFGETNITEVMLDSPLLRIT